MHPHREAAKADLKRRLKEFKHEDEIKDTHDMAKAVTKGVHEHERHDHAGKPLTKIKLAHGGRAKEREVEGRAAGGRLDRAGHGGKSKGKSGTKVNVIVAGGGGPGAGGRPVPVPVPVRPPMGAAPAGGPPNGAMPPRPMPPPGAIGPTGPIAGMGAAPGGMPPGAMGMRKSGGRAKGRTRA